MTKAEIGFRAPENPDKTWKKQVNGRSFVFKKAREKSVFLYSCQRRSKAGTIESELLTSFYSERDLTSDEVEQCQQFADFIALR